MNYATTTYQIGNAQIAKIPKTKTTAPTVARFHKMDATCTGRIGNQKGQKTATPAINVANGFLKARFLPRLESDETVQATHKTAKMERDFYKSLSQLAQHYGIVPMDTKQFAYPYNIALSMWDIKRQLKDKVACFSALDIVTEKKKTFLRCEEQYNLGATLYYIPVQPLYLLLQTPQTKKAATLLLSVCCYLYHIAGVPYYRNQESYLFCQYEMLEEWILNDDDTDENEIYKSDLKVAKWVGNCIEQKLYNPKNIEYFNKRIQQFTYANSSEKECLRLANEAYSLLMQYPNEKLYRYAIPSEPYQESDEYEVITIDKLISFSASATGWLSAQLVECINSELCEYSDTEAPTIIKRFNGKPVQSTSLDFEHRLFTLVDDLVYLLSNFKK